MAPRPAPILVVDDDAKIVRLVRTYLEREGFRVVEASDGRTALAAIALEAPDLVVLDLMLPEVDGLSIVRAVRRTERTPIVMISARGTTSDRIAGLTEGADDYLPKPFSPAELVVRVKRILDRVRPDGGGAARPVVGAPSTPLLRLGDLELDADRFETRVAGRPVVLTPLEFRCLRVLVEAEGRVLTRDGLMDAVYGEASGFVLDRSIDALVTRLRRKLGDDADDPRFVVTVRGVGYRAGSGAASPASAAGGAGAASPASAALPGKAGAV